MLNTINSYLPLLNHYYRIEKVHPEMLYQVLVQLAGSLTTFSIDINPRDIVPYDHNDLTKTFEELNNTIEQLLGIPDS